MPAGTHPASPSKSYRAVKSNRYPLDNKHPESLPAAGGPSHRRQDHAEGAALALGAFHPEPPPVPVHDMLHDGQAKPGAALFAGPVAVHAVEPLGQARQVDRINPLALIRPVEPEGAARAARGPAPRGSP